MVPADRDRLRTRIDYIRGGVVRLQEIAKNDRDRFLEDHLLQAAAIRYLQTSIEAMLDIANHIVAREGLGTPRSYQEAIDLLVAHGTLRVDDQPAYREMVRFRNRAVHLYDRIEASEVYKILSDDLDDFEKFISAIVKRYFD